MFGCVHIILYYIIILIYSKWNGYLVHVRTEILGCALGRCLSLGSSSGMTHYYYHHLIRPWAFIDVNAVFFPVGHCSLCLSHTRKCNLIHLPSPFRSLSLPLCGGKLIDTMSCSIFTPLFSVSASLHLWVSWPILLGVGRAGLNGEWCASMQNNGCDFDLLMPF